MTRIPTSFYLRESNVIKPFYPIQQCGLPTLLRPTWCSHSPHGPVSVPFNPTRFSSEGVPAFAVTSYKKWQCPVASERAQDRKIPKHYSFASAIILLPPPYYSDWHQIARLPATLGAPQYTRSSVMANDLKHSSFPFLRLPAEIRTNVYQLLLAPDADGLIPIRTEAPKIHKARNAVLNRRRTRYRVISDRVRSHNSETSYTGYKPSGIETNILRVCRQIHEEACHTLYSENTFDFDIDIESLMPFFSDLTTTAQASVRSVRLVKRALPYCNDFDRCEWRSACRFLATHTKLRHVTLAIVGGRPRPVWGAPVGHWDSHEPWDIGDFSHIIQSERMDWARELMSIKNLRTLKVIAALQHCPPPRSKEMVFFANFTANIESGFSAYLKSVMLDGSSLS
ncbi:MAG: hypothetical protein Q9169_004938 [Polycauliona sp. 2 TL-2023]